MLTDRLRLKPNNCICITKRLTAPCAGLPERHITALSAAPRLSWLSFIPLEFHNLMTLLRAVGQLLELFSYQSNSYVCPAEPEGLEVLTHFFL